MMISAIDSQKQDKIKMNFISQSSMKKNNIKNIYFKG